MIFEYNNEVFESKPETRICDGCTFKNEDEGCDAAETFYNCTKHKVIWVKKEELDISLDQSSKALSTQEGGNHYKELNIQPVTYIHANNLSFLEGNVVKYVTRHKQKDGVKDIKKAIHYLNLILELEYSKVTQ